jgi:hypothetical protein
MMKSFGPLLVAGVADRGIAAVISPAPINEPKSLRLICRFMTSLLRGRMQLRSYPQSKPYVPREILLHGSRSAAECRFVSRGDRQRSLIYCCISR